MKTPVVRLNALAGMPPLVGPAIVPKPPPPTFNVGPLMNDVQTVAWLAAILPNGNFEERVNAAHDILVEAFRRRNRLDALLKAVQAAESAAKETDNVKQ